MSANIQAQADLFETFKGRKATHYDLARQLERAGFAVEMDAENNERSEVKLQDCWNPDGSDTVIGEIRGDAEAVIV